MEFNYLVEKKRMLDSLGRMMDEVISCLNVNCTLCPLSKYASGSGFNCRVFEIEHPIKATEIVRKWANEHPRKTRKDVLFEKFPKAEICKDGSPYSCCAALGMIPKEQCNENCTKCWNTDVE